MEQEGIVFTVIYSLLLVALSLVTITMNGACIYIISVTRELSKSASSILIRCLLFIHFVQGLVVFPIYMAKKIGVHSPLWYRVICDGFRFSFMATFYMAIYCMVLIALDRVFAVTFVIRYREFVTRKRVKFCIIFLWMYIILLCLSPFRNPDNDPVMEGFYGRIKCHFNSSISHVHKYYIATCNYNQSKTWTLSMLIYNCLIPYVAMVTMYKYIGHKVRRIEIKSNLYSPSFQSKKHVKHKNITRVCYLLLITHLITWVPSIVYYIIWSVCPQSCFAIGFKRSYVETYVGFFTKYLAFLDAVASPAIYCCYSEQFRKFWKNKNNRDGLIIQSSM